MTQSPIVCTNCGINPPGKYMHTCVQCTRNVNSTSDERTVNNVMRHEYRKLTDDEKTNMQAIKDMGLIFYEAIDKIGSSRELSLAKTKVEEAVMWAVKHITQ